MKAFQCIRYNFINLKSGLYGPAQDDSQKVSYMISEQVIKYLKNNNVLDLYFTFR